MPSALALARHVANADATIVAMGPGSSARVAARHHRARGGRGSSMPPPPSAGTPIAVLRMSDGDPRPRHQGVSHHSRTALDLTRSSVLVASPVEGAFAHDRHDVRVVDGPDVGALLAGSGLHITTMGAWPGRGSVVLPCHRRRGARSQLLILGQST